MPVVARKPAASQFGLPPKPLTPSSVKTTKTVATPFSLGYGLTPASNATASPTKASPFSLASGSPFEEAAQRTASTGIELELAATPSPKKKRNDAEPAPHPFLLWLVSSVAQAANAFITGFDLPIMAVRLLRLLRLLYLLHSLLDTLGMFLITEVHPNPTGYWQLWL